MTLVADPARLAARTRRDRHDLARAALGWLVYGGMFFVLWFVYPRGLGYGDVRLSGVLGLALGWVGWAELVVGIWVGLLLGGVLGGVLALVPGAGGTTRSARSCCSARSSGVVLGQPVVLRQLLRLTESPA